MSHNISKRQTKKVPEVIVKAGTQIFSQLNFTMKCKGGTGATKDWLAVWLYGPQNTARKGLGKRTQEGSDSGDHCSRKLGKDLYTNIN